MANVLQVSQLSVAYGKVEAVSQVSLNVGEGQIVTVIGPNGAGKTTTLSAIMARTSAFTGKEVTWDEIMKSDLVLEAPDYALTEANMLAHVPVPGKPARASASARPCG